MPLIKKKVCHYFTGDMVGGGITKKLANSDIGKREV